MDGRSNGPEPILRAHLLRKVDEKLIDLLSSLTPGEWDLPTVAGAWTVRDVAAHLLDTPPDAVIDHLFPPYTEKVRALSQSFEY